MAARLTVAFAVVALAACGGNNVRSADGLRKCVNDRLPAGAVDRVLVTDEEGVTSINYYHHGDETNVSVFPSATDAAEAEKAEARLGDAHDRRIRNVLYGGGGVIEAAVVACMK